MSLSESSQLTLSAKKGPKPTGDVWQPSSSNPASVPVPLPVIMVRVEGPFTALDRKLWLILLHHAWAGLAKGEAIHAISIAELLRLFRQHGRHDLGQRGELRVTRSATEETEAVAIWASVRRLVKTTVEWEHEAYQAIAGLLGHALMTKEHRQSGWLNYSFGPVLAEKLLDPNVFARLKTHLMMRMRSKYAVTLYEILEAYANRKYPICIVSVDEFQSWLKVPDKAYPDWRELKKRVIDIAVDEINANAAECGFTVAYEGVRQGKAFTKIKFTMTKTDGRQERDAMLSRKATVQRRRVRAAAGLADPDNPPVPSGDGVDKFRAKWPGHDPHEVIGRFQDKWRSEGCAVIRKPDAAFLKFAEGMFKARNAKAKVAA